MVEPTGQAFADEPEHRVSRFIFVPALPLFALYDTLFGGWSYELVASWLLASWAAAIGAIYGNTLARRQRNSLRPADGRLAFSVSVYLSAVAYVFISGSLQRAVGDSKPGTGHFAVLLAAAVLMGTPTVLVFKTRVESVGSALVRAVPALGATLCGSAGWLLKPNTPAFTTSLLLLYAAALTAASLAFRSAKHGRAGSTAREDAITTPDSGRGPAALPSSSTEPLSLERPSPLMCSVAIGLALYLGFRLVFGAFRWQSLVSWCLSSIAAGSAFSYEIALRSTVPSRRLLRKKATDLILVPMAASVGAIALTIAFMPGNAEMREHGYWLALSIGGAAMLFPAYTLLQYRKNTLLSAGAALALGGGAYSLALVGTAAAGKSPVLELTALSLYAVTAGVSAAMYQRGFGPLMDQLRSDAAKRSSKVTQKRDRSGHPREARSPSKG
jgi:hypothetical protein